MVAEIKALNPKPGLAFDGVPPQPVVPDILMRPHRRRLGHRAQQRHAAARPGQQPLLRRSVRRAPRSKADKDYLAERYQQANWLVKALHQRATTILKVATEIVRQQEGFFRHGVQHLRPLVLRDIADGDRHA